MRDRFLLDGRDTQRPLALVQHTFPPRALAVPMHRHKEGEHTYL